MKETIVYVGVDVAKAHLDVAWQDRVGRFPNDNKGRTALVAWIKQSDNALHLICEASGGYERGLVESLQQSGVKVSLVQANRVRQYARAAGILAKTDKVDARVLATFGAAMQPKATLPQSVQHKQLREYDTERRHLIATLLAEQNRLAQLTDAQLRSLKRNLIGIIKKQIALLDLAITNLIAQDQELRTKAQKLTSVRGIGARTAALVLAQLPELGQLNRRQTAALAGLAPFNRDSGTLRGKRTIYGGRRTLRSGLYMAALTAARHNEILAPFYRRLRAKGKSHKLALTAVMRKLLIALNHTLKPNLLPA